MKYTIFLKPFSLLLLLLIAELSFSQSDPDNSIAFYSSNLPVVIINTNGQQIPDDPKIMADFKIIYNGPGERNYILARLALRSEDQAVRIFLKKATASNYGMIWDRKLILIFWECRKRVTGY